MRFFGNRKTTTTPTPQPQSFERKFGAQERVLPSDVPTLERVTAVHATPPAPPVRY